MTAIARRQCLADLLRRSAARAPDRLAIVCGETRWTYAEFDALVSRLAAGLASVGVQPGDRVAALARNSHAFAALRFALARMAAVFVPVNFMLNAKEVAFILGHAGARFLATDTGLAETARAARALAATVEKTIWLPSEEASERPADMLDFGALAACGDPPPEVEMGEQDLLQIVYTSGTESLPKGAMLTHQAVIWQYSSVVMGLEIAADDLLVHPMPLFHCAQLDAFLGPGVYVGATNVITAKPTPDNLLPMIEKFRATGCFAPPTIWIGLLRSPLFDKADLSSLRKGYTGASIMPVPVLLELAERLPKMRIWNVYGQTEIAPCATALGPEDQLRKAGSCGKPLLNVETRVVDLEMNDVRLGEIGEVVHRSPHLMTGYFRDDERTSQAFEGGWFHSGDLATIDAEGFITIVDRKKDMIKSGGENVASREVEEALYKMPAISEIAVVGVPHPVWIEAVVAVVVLKNGHAATEDEVLDYARERLAHFKTPKRVLFVDALPKNPSGKLLKRQLRDAHAKLFGGGASMA